MWKVLFDSPKPQYLLIVAALLLIAILYLCFDTVPSSHKLVEKSRAENFESTDIRNVLKEATDGLIAGDAEYLQALQGSLATADTDTQRITVLKTLSGEWYRMGRFDVAGYFAEEIAKLQQTEDAWAIAGTTYAQGLTVGTNADRTSPDIRRSMDFSIAGAERAFQSAISMNPQKLDHRINLAISYAEYPPEGNPMKGIVSLLDLNRQHPKDVKVLYHLARFGLRTGQYDKAIQRLTRAVEIEPNTARLHCLLAEAHRSAGDVPNAEKAAQRCAALK